jgi:hypothetical protein
MGKNLPWVEIVFGCQRLAARRQLGTAIEWRLTHLRTSKAVMRAGQERNRIVLRVLLRSNRIPPRSDYELINYFTA